MFRKNLKFKLLALAVALVIWAYANRIQEPHLSRQVVRLPLQVRDLERNCIVTSIPKTVKVVLEGPSGHVASLVAEPDSIIVYVSLRGIKSSKHSVPVVVRLPSGMVGVVNAVPLPEVVSVSVERITQRVLEVKFRWANPPPEGFDTVRPHLVPNRATVSGRSGLVAKITTLAVMVDPSQVVEKGIDDDFDITALDMYGRTVTGVSIVPARVRVQVPEWEIRASRALLVGVDAVGLPPAPYEVVGIEVSPSTIVVNGAPSRVARTNILRTEPIRLAEHTKTFSQRVRVIIPEGLSVQGGEYVRVTVKIEGPPPEEPLTEN